MDRRAFLASLAAAPLAAASAVALPMRAPLTDAPVTLRKGDVITIEGAWNVGPIRHRYPSRCTYVVVADVIADA